VSTLFTNTKTDPTKYFKATNTLVARTPSSTSASDGNGGSDVNSDAFMLRSATVLGNVAKTMGMKVSDVSNELAANPRTDVNAIDVTAISTDPQRAVKLANTGATELAAYVAATDQKTYNDTLADVQKKLATAKTQRDDLETQLTAPGADRDLINAQLSSVLGNYTQLYEQYQGLIAQGGPATSLTTLQSAAAIQINGRAFYFRQDQNQNARGQVNTATQTSTPDFNETDLSTAPPLSRKLRLIIGIVAGLVMGVITAFLVEAWDDRLRRRDRVEDLTGLTVIAEIPKLTRDQARDHDIPVVDAPGSRAAERYRAARTSILFALQRQEVVGPAPQAGAAGRARVVMVTSPSPGEGKTTTVASLAAVFGESGLRTLVIDCDFRKPAIGRFLAPQLDLSDPLQPVATRLEGVSFLPAPATTAQPADAVTHLRRAVHRWQDQFDIVLLDTPPMLTTNDATDLFPVADAVVLVLRAGQSRSGPAERAAVVLARFRAEVLGIILNGSDDPEADSYYGYGEGYLADGVRPSPTDSSPSPPSPSSPPPPPPPPSSPSSPSSPA
jgi:Mrp family chromosome partitioning ATPase/capsular polysaccharide biosynthesis protein